MTMYDDWNHDFSAKKVYIEWERVWKGRERERVIRKKKEERKKKRKRKKKIE